MAEQPSSSSSSWPGGAPVPVVFRAQTPPPRPPQLLRSDQDLLDAFGLHAAYDKYVRPHIKPLDQQDTPPHPQSALDKGKGRLLDSLGTGAGASGAGAGLGGRQVSMGPVAGPSAPIKTEPGADGDEDGLGGKKKKKEQSYRHLIRHLPGKHTMKKDNHLMTLINAPPKQRMPIVPFDAGVLARAFTVKDGGLPGYNKAVLIGLDDKEKEAKKRKKEEKRLAKERARLVAAGQLDPNAPMPTTSSAHGNVVLTGTIVNRPSSVASTPRPTHPQQVATPSSRRPSVAAPGPSAQPGSRAATPKPLPPRLPSVKAETPAPSIPTPVRANAPTQQQTPAGGATPRPPVNRPGSAAAAQRAAQQQQGAGPRPGPTQPQAAAAQARPQPQRMPSQPGSSSAQQQRPPARPPGTGAPGSGSRPPNGTGQPAPVRGVVRKEREDDVTRGTPSAGGPRPAKKQRVDGGPGSAPGSARILQKQQPTPQTS